MQWKEFFDAESGTPGTAINGSIGERSIILWDEAFDTRPDEIFALAFKEEGENQRIRGIYDNYEVALKNFGFVLQKNNAQNIYRVDRSGASILLRDLVLKGGVRFFSDD